MTLEDWQYLPYQIDPIIVRFGSLTIGWYWVMYIVGFTVVYFLLKFRAKRNQPPMRQNQLFDALYWMFIGMILGARLGYVILYDFQYYIQHPLEIISPFMYGDSGIIYKGIFGMSFHGGLLGAVAGLYIFARKYALSFIALADFIVPAVPLGYFFGRIGNFLNGELYGKATESEWGMYFPRSFAIDGTEIRRYPSQLIEALLEGIVLFIVLWVLRDKLKANGATSAAFIGGYGIARFVAEFWREPDAHIGLVGGSVSMGQLLSLAMILWSIIMFIVIEYQEN